MASSRVTSFVFCEMHLKDVYAKYNKRSQPNNGLRPRALSSRTNMPKCSEFEND